MDYEDAHQLRREANVRKSMLADFNKRLEDFDTERAYNDYLEWVEDLIVRKMVAPDDEDLRNEIEAYRRSNSELIRKNEVLRKDADRAAREKVATEERAHQIQLASLRLTDEANEADVKKHRDEAAMDRMNLAAMDPAQRKKEKRKREKKQAAEQAAEEVSRLAKLRVGLSSMPMVLPRHMQMQLPAVISSALPPDRDAPVDLSVRAYAGGFKEAFQIDRAHLELMSSLFI